LNSPSMLETFLPSPLVRIPARIHEALSNLRNQFTVVGLTEELQMMVQRMWQASPWLAEHMKESEMNCSLPHANASPSNNHCGPGNTHGDLPPHPNAETARQLIIEHNQLNMQLCKAAVQHFEFKKCALGWAKETDYLSDTSINVGDTCAVRP
jgi:hypothetical protein